VAATAVSPKAKVNLKTIALPASHGGWGFLLEPILLGLWLAPSLAGLALGVAATGAFLAQQPLKLALTDWRKGRRYPRTGWAERFALLYGGVSLAALILAIAGSRISSGCRCCWQTPAALAQLYFAARNRGRELLPELLGAGALSAVAPAITLAEGWPIDLALAGWAILLARALPSIVYVRARLRLERGQLSSRWLVGLAHLGAGLAIIALAALGLAPWLAVLAMVVLFGRAIVGLSVWRKPLPPKFIGVQELAYGLMTVALAAIGYGIF
jgi:hypothetical protein